MLSQKEKGGKIKNCLKWMILLECDLYASEHLPLKSNMEFYIFLLMLDRVFLVFISLVKMFCFSDPLYLLLVAMSNSISEVGDLVNTH